MRLFSAPYFTTETSGEPKFTASSYPTTVTAESAKGNDVPTTEAGSVECKTHSDGGLTSASETLSITPTYTECRAFGFLSMELKMNGCTYTDHTNGEMDLACPSGKVVEMHVSTCAAAFGPQSGLKTLELANGTGNFTVKANVSGIAYTVTNDGFACSFNGTGAKTGATYKQTNAITVKSTGSSTIDIG